jgi:hypothetical protein
MKPGRIVAASIALIALAIAGWQMLGGDESKEEKASGLSATKNAQPLRMGGADVPPVPVVGSGETKGIQRARIGEPEMAGDFPIHSRPYLETDPSFSHPNGYSLERVPVGESDREERSKEALLYVVFVGNRSAVVGANSFRSTLEVYGSAEGEQRLEVEELRAEIVELDASPESALAAASYTDTGSDGDETAGDLRYSHEFSPSAEGLSAGRYAIRATIKAGGLTAEASVPFVYTPGPEASGRFTGVFDESIVDADLVIGVVVELQSAGEFIIDGNLHPTEGLPIGRARFRGPLAKGRHVVELQFVGKLFADAGKSGPYLLRNLRGFRVDKERPGGRQELYGGGIEFQTEPYELSVFSP